MRLITVEGLGVRRGGHQILDNVDLTLDQGEIVTVVGPNGSGKSTLLRAIIGALPAQGQITRKPGLRIGYVPQKLHLDHTLPLTVQRFLDLPRTTPAAEAQAALIRVGAADLVQRQMADLSGGQLQRVQLARAIVSKPELLILDEATQGLDQRGSAEFYRLIEELARDMKCAVLMVSHELHVVMAASDRVVCLNGHVCCHGTPQHVASAPEYRALFGTGTGGALALYRHHHDHAPDHHHDHDHSHGHSA